MSAEREKREEGGCYEVKGGGGLVGWRDVVVVVGLGGRDVGAASSKVCLRCKSDEDF